MEITKTDISNRADIELLVDRFYQSVQKDAVIGPYFTDLNSFSWDTHIPVMYNFWETVLLNNMAYKGNPILKHIELDKKLSIHPQHFDQWLMLWQQTIDAHFEGEIASRALEKAKLMRTLMLMKIEASRKPGFIQ